MVPKKGSQAILVLSVVAGTTALTAIPQNAGKYKS